MFAWFGDLTRFFLRVVTHERSPRQVGLAIALGVVIGLVPKINLIALGLIFLLFALRINILAGLLTAAVFSWVGLLIEPALDHLGRCVLTLVPLQGLFAWLYELPYAPWTAFNNTVVMGALFLGALQFYPTYRFVVRHVEKRMGTYQEWRVRPSVSANEV